MNRDGARSRDACDVTVGMARLAVSESTYARHAKCARLMGKKEGPPAREATLIAA
jgi:hypothetical protein